MASARSLRLLLILLCGALALVIAGNSALAIALPDVGRDLLATQSDLTWIIDAYALTFAALLLPAGIAADRVGRRTLITAGLAVLAIATIASAFATTPEVLIAGRAVAGAGAALVFPVTLSALVDAYPEERRPFAVAVWSAVSAAGAVFGTLVSGALLEAIWWGSVQLAFGVAALALIPGLLRLVEQRRNPALSLNPGGAVLSALALGLLVYAVIEAPKQGWTDPGTLTPMAAGLLAMAAFVAYEWRAKAPSLDVRLFRDRGLAAGCLLVSMQFFASLALFVLAPQYLQLVRGYSSIEAALALLIIPVGAGAGTALAPPALARIGARWPAAGGLASMAAGFAVVAAQIVDGSVWVVGIGLVVFGFGFGLAITPARH